MEARTDDLASLVVFIHDRTQLRNHFLNPPDSRLRAAHDFLAQSGIVTDQKLDAATAEHAREPGIPISQVLRRNGSITEDDLAWIHSGTFGIPLVDASRFDAEEVALALIPVEFARRHLVLPLMLLDGTLIVAVTDPSDAGLLEELKFLARKPISIAVATGNDILVGIASHYAHDEIAQARALVEISSAPIQEESGTQEDMFAGPVVALVQNLISDATIVRRASDIHVRPSADSTDIFFRIDGMLVRQLVLNRKSQMSVVSRLKIIGGMDISERRLPQDGRAKVRFANKNIDLRLSVIPGINGEDVVVRLLDSQNAMQNLGQLGYEGSDADRIAALMSRTSGLFLVTGPTGSGKSTTLYTLLEQIRSDTLNIVTIEDPVEFHTRGFMQIQVNSQIDFTFAKALRHVLRHDPNIIMIGEIRDAETARIAVECSLTGHQVLSTLHTNSAAATITRFLEIGIPAYLINSTLTGVLAQRLVRKNCPHCLVRENVSAGIRAEMRALPDEAFFIGKGCAECDQRGVRGRRAVYELLVMSNAIRGALNNSASAQELQKLAVDGGMTPLATHALHLARAGSISLAEAYRVRLD